MFMIDLIEEMLTEANANFSLKNISDTLWPNKRNQ